MVGRRLIEAVLVEQYSSELVASQQMHFGMRAMVVLVDVSQIPDDCLQQ